MPKIAKITELPETQLSPEHAQMIWDRVNKFAAYGFNKSHAAAYAVIAFRTAYLKRHYPYEFYAASMNLDLDKREKLAEFNRECQREGLKVLPPNVNTSQATFSVRRRQDGTADAIRWALAAIGGVGVAAMRGVIAERDAKGRFTSFEEFVRRTIAWCNKKCYENLILAGACDDLKLSRKAMLHALETVIKCAQTEAKEAESPQASLFGDALPAQTRSTVKDLPEMPRLELLEKEFAALGVYVSGHPIDSVRGAIARTQAKSIAEVLSPRFTWRTAKVGVLALKVESRMTRKQEQMGIVMMSDPTGMYEAVVFPDDFRRLRQTLKQGEAYILTLGVSERDGQRSFSVRDAEPLKLEALTPALGQVA
ncbi:hypothetical protein CKO28_04880 [Rhodovibrio sodomensis]|uniref:DNA polymerase helix-hairpin-helix motif domain-containing protein n=1 Tax=Rhodovibrio sodomensis TaxID=1088 RepID=A0ABS1DA99_9PROT|nr:hypothetical protein [Rhodovibrio sodomensis]MBK1667363.1 hypothetical protein [Rhodovibrio sodomensis]